MSLVVERQPIDLSTLPENLHKHLDPAAPAPLKMMAAKGMLPVLPEQNIAMLYALAMGTDNTAKSEATSTLDGMPADIVVPALGSTSHEGVLDWVAERHKDNAFVLDAIVTNRSTNDFTVARIARFAGPNLCDVIATNQVRVLQAPVILEQMYQNANARMATVDRLLELVQREGVQLKGLPGVQAVLATGRDVFGEGTGDNDEFFKEQAAIGDEEAKKAGELEQLSRSERKRLEDEAEQEAEQKGGTNIAAQISNMSISEKIRLSTIGGRGALNVLIRDPNKLVHMAAVRSPRIQYADIRSWSKNKTLPDGVISFICSQKDYIRHYEVMLGLCQNPKTPMADTMKFLNHLRTNDLKKLSSDRGVSTQIRRQAKNLSKKRSGG